MRIYIPSSGPESWRPLLGDPLRHWVDGRSAWLLAHAWEAANGIPQPVAEVLGTSSDPALHDLEVLAAFPELKTDLPGGRRASQTDLLVLAKSATSGGLVVLGVEGKVDEPFGPMVTEWLVGASPGKHVRLTYLCKRLGLEPSAVGEIRYQLLHRLVAAMLEAERFTARRAVLLIHSFDPADAGFADYAHFVELLGGEAAVDSSSEVATACELRVSAAWVRHEALAPNNANGNDLDSIR